MELATFYGAALVVIPKTIISADLTASIADIGPELAGHLHCERRCSRTLRHTAATMWPCRLR